MTATKNVYALMLALVIVLSGCFGMAGDESDAQDSGSDGNDGDLGNESGHEEDDWGTQYFADVGSIELSQTLCENNYSGSWSDGGDSQWCSGANSLDALTISSNHSFIQIIDWSYLGDGYAQIITQCADGGDVISFRSWLNDESMFSENGILPGAGSDEGCTHTLEVTPYHTDYTSWSIAWSETPVTVV